MLLDWTLLLGGLVLLYFGADWLIRGGARLGMRVGLSPLVVGLTIVAFGTSTPELFVACSAAFDGKGGMAVGNVLGSNMFNIAVILGIAVLFRPLTVRIQLLRFDIPLLILSSLLTCWFLVDGWMARWEGIILFSGILGYTYLNYRLAKRKPSEDVLEEFSSDMPELKGTPVNDFLWILLGLVFLSGGAQAMVEGAVGIARDLGISETIIGLIILAAGTSLPELACSLLAALKDKGDIAIGNIVGSSIFNLLAILGVTASLVPVQAGDVLLIDKIYMVGVAIFLLPLASTGFVLRRWEGVLLLLLYASYLYQRWP